MTDEIMRFWGGLRPLWDRGNLAVTILRINPGESISKHHHRRHVESWVVIEGQARFEIEGKVSFPRRGETLFAPIGATHQIRNPGSEPLLLLETKIGSDRGDADTFRAGGDLVRRIAGIFSPKSASTPGASAPRTERLWGAYTVLFTGETYNVKILEVKPGESISKQFHRRRSESWVVTDGTARVELDDEPIHLGSGETVWIPVGAIHRLENQTLQPLTLVEAQIGDYFGEDDIVRLEDKYGRAGTVPNADGSERK